MELHEIADALSRAAEAATQIRDLEDEVLSLRESLREADKRAKRLAQEVEQAKQKVKLSAKDAEAMARSQVTLRFVWQHDGSFRLVFQPLGRPKVIFSGGDPKDLLESAAAYARRSEK